MDKCIFATETLHSQSQMLGGRSGSLPVDQVPVSESILKQRSHCVNVIFGHFSNVLKHEGQTLQDTILDVQLLDPVLIHQGWQNCERTARLGNNSDGYCCADSQLSFLDFQVIE